MRVKYYLSILIVILIAVYTGVAMAEVGSFQVTINNTGTFEVLVGVHAELRDVLDSYRDRILGSATTVKVKAGESVTVKCLSPHVRSREAATGLPLPAGSKVVVYLHWANKSIEKSYPAKYVAGTGIIDVPDTEFDANFDS